MKQTAITNDMLEAVVAELSQNALFGRLSQEVLRHIAQNATLVQYEAGEIIMRQGDAPDSFYLIVSGEMSVRAARPGRDEPVEIARTGPFQTIGEIGLLLSKPRTATVVAGPDAALLKFDRTFFSDMFSRYPEFGLITCRILAERLDSASRSSPLCRARDKGLKPDMSLLALLPPEFVQRHRVLPLALVGNTISLGFVEDPEPETVNAIRQLLPGMELNSFLIDAADYAEAMKGASLASEKKAQPPRPAQQESASKSPRLDRLLRRMVAEGASDLHLSAGHKPRWRIDGEMLVIEDCPELGSSETLELVEPIMPERIARQYRAENDADFAYAIPGVARFRVNVFCDHRGSGAVFRQIPDTILTVEQLGLPPTVRSLCDYPKGLILVTGPTGSGKSTTLAAMIDHINRTRKAHVITMEDPIEFVHESKMCLINQREVGPHTSSFARALKAALREDPDIVLVGEMRDLETISLALETANTGHLVLATLHTNTAVSSISRIIDMFPAEQQNQVRSVLADTLRGVIAQTLCRKTGGGRVAALEILVCDVAIASLIRDGKTHQIVSAMQTGKGRGNCLLNDELFRLVQQRVISAEEAVAKAVDKADLAKRLGQQQPSGAA